MATKGSKKAAQSKTPASPSEKAKPQNAPATDKTASTTPKKSTGKNH